MTDVQVPVEEFNGSIHKGQLQVLKDFDSKKKRFFLINWHRRARKSTLSINLLIREACTHNNSRYGYITSTYTAAKNIIWRDPNMLKKYLPMQLVKRINESEMFVEFINGSLLSIHGGDNPDSVRGVDFAGIVIDESPLCKRELWEEILRPIIAQNKDRWAMFIFTPKGKNWVYEYWVKMKDNAEWQTYKLSAEDSGIIPIEELEKVRKEVPERTFSQEFGCEFNDSASSVFKNIDLCVSGELEGYLTQYTYVTGVDLAKVEDFTVLTTMCRETRRVVGWERFNQVDWSFQKEKILAHCRKYNSQAIIDATGIGDPICEDLSRSGLTVVPFKISATTKKELIEKLIVSIEQRMITFPIIPELIGELGCFNYNVTDFGNIRYSAPEGMHDDCVISLALAVMGMKSFIYGKKPRAIDYTKPRKDFANAGFGFKR